MRFNLIDRVHSWEAGKSLRASKNLTLGEEYLADHFPTFPVMPGVMMLQAAIEASAWLWRLTADFRHPVIVMREVKNVKYGTFMQPGFTLELATELVKSDESTATFKAKGNVAGGGQTINAMFTLTGYGTGDGVADQRLIGHWKERWAWLTAGVPGRAA